MCGGAAKMKIESEFEIDREVSARHGGDAGGKQGQGEPRQAGK